MLTKTSKMMLPKQLQQVVYIYIVSPVTYRSYLVFKYVLNIKGIENIKFLNLTLFLVFFKLSLFILNKNLTFSLSRIVRM